MVTTPSKRQVRTIPAAARFLDKQFPGWAQKINTSRFSLGSGSLCVLASLFGSYDNGVRKLKLPFFGNHAFTVVLFEDGVSYDAQTGSGGQLLPMNKRNARFNRKQKNWLKEINSRA